MQMCMLLQTGMSKFPKKRSANTARIDHGPSVWPAFSRNAHPLASCLLPGHHIQPTLAHVAVSVWLAADIITTDDIHNGNLLKAGESQPALGCPLSENFAFRLSGSNTCGMLLLLCC